MDKKFKNILITGGAGYVGSVLTGVLLRNGYRVRVLDSLRVGSHGIISFFSEDGFEFIKGDIRDEKTVKAALEGQDLVVHLAAIIGSPACKREPVLSRDINVRGTEVLLGQMPDGMPIVFASTGTVYGEVKDDICTEETDLNPTSEYSVHKVEGEELIRARNDNYVIYRFATGFGASPRMRTDNVPNDFTYRAVHEGALVVYEKDAIRSFIHVRDMAKAFQFAIENFDKMKGQEYNIGHTDLNITKEALCNMILGKVDYHLHFAEIGTDVDKRDYPVSYDKMISVGFSPDISLEDGIDELVRVVQAL